MFVTVVQDRVLAVWFKDKLALAFGIMVSVLRLGSVLNFLISPHIAARYGISTALWVGKYSLSINSQGLELQCLLKVKEDLSQVLIFQHNTLYAT